MSMAASHVRDTDVVVGGGMTTISTQMTLCTERRVLIPSILTFYERSYTPFKNSTPEDLPISCLVYPTSSQQFPFEKDILLSL
jgi:hypothetical protein